MWINRRGDWCGSLGGGGLPWVDKVGEGCLGGSVYFGGLRVLWWRSSELLLVYYVLPVVSEDDGE